MELTRRSILRGAVAAAVAHAAGATPSAQREAPFLGRTAGEARQIEGLAFCWCPPGHFMMGSPATEPDHRADEAQVAVTLTRGFWVATFETTQRQWRRIAGEFPDRKPAGETGEGDDVPVYWVNFHEAERFCGALEDRAHRSGALPDDWTCRLPTEAQWEYACRAGTTTATSFGHLLERSQANFGPLSGRAKDPSALRRASRVGSYPPNPWGICDMHGNIFEWCRDWYHARLPGGTDPDLSGIRGIPNRDGTYSRARRGGSWADERWACRSACRLRYEPDRRSDHIGFRVVAVKRGAAVAADIE